MIPYAGPLPDIQGRHFTGLYLSSDNAFSTENWGVGSGGLSVVSESINKELERNFVKYQTSMLTVGFYCPHGYVRQRMNHEGVMEIHYEKDPHPEWTPDTGRRVTVMLAGRPCVVAIHMPRDMERHHTAAILLNTDLPGENPEDFCMITRVLYGEKHATRFFGNEWQDVNWLRMLQSMVLGLGAFYALKEFDITYDFAHLNDTHPAFFLVHLYGLARERGLSHEEALAEVAQVGRFTCHTVLEQANRSYNINKIAEIGRHYAGFTVDMLRALAGSDHAFKMTTVTLKLVGPRHANCVSIDHARIASALFDYNFFAITNGVDVPVYADKRFSEITNWYEIPLVKKEIKLEVLHRLIAKAREAGWRGGVPDVMAWLDSLLIAWARRCQDYKRLGLLFHENEFELLKAMLEWGWISVAFGGLVHGDDEDMLRNWNKYLRKMSKFQNFMPIFNYNLELIRPSLKAAAEIWLNTPWYGYEACGTSYMTALLNCARVVSIADGGVKEAKHHIITFGSTEQGTWNTQFENDAQSLWQALVPEIVLLRRKDPATLQSLLDARDFATDYYSSARMTKAYVEQLWV